VMKETSWALQWFFSFVSADRWPESKGQRSQHTGLFVVVMETWSCNELHVFVCSIM
jgi:hypothetical protein